MKQLRICFTTDTHGFFFPTNFYSAAERDLPMGLIRLANGFHKDENTLILDGGDTLQGSPLTHYLSKHGAAPIAAFMNLAGYDYVVPGNHDFNYGVDYLAEYLNAVHAKSLCANIRDKEGLLPLQSVALHTLPNGLRIALFGACTHHILRWEAQQTLDRLHIDPPIPRLQAALAALKEEVDLRVCIYHGGFEADPDTGRRLTDSDENQAYEIAQTLGFDILLTGHQHIALPGRYIGNTYVVQNTNAAMDYCEIKVDWDEDSGRIAAIHSRHMPPAAYCPALAAPLLPAYEAVERWLDQPLGQLSCALRPLPPLQSALEGSLIANFVNQIQLAEGGCMLSACSLANEIKGLEATVSVRDVLSTYVYSNTLLVLELDGRRLKAYMERSAAYFALRDGTVCVSEDFLLPKVAHYNYDYFYGLDYAIDLRRPVGERIVRMDYRGRAIQPEDRVSIIVNSYRASGTGGYDMLLGAAVRKDIQKEVSALIIEQLERHSFFQVDEHIPYRVLW